MKFYLRKRAPHLARTIYHLFEPVSDRELRFKRKRVPAAEGIAACGGCKVTVIKARRYLGVASQYIAGVHTWLPPTVTLDVALDHMRGSKSKSSMYRVARSPAERRAEYAMTISAFLTRLFSDTPSFSMTAKQAHKMYREQGGTVSSNGPFYAGKNLAGIKSLRLDSGSWAWFYPHPLVKQWLETQLKSGPRSQDELFRLAAERGWAPQLINLFRHRAGFAQVIKDGKWHWYEIGVWAPEVKGGAE